ncbi:uncharacterized protein FTOL_08208 [Fusarium torulosum]|uniref:Reverse transcriptase domain-containing protein n=1 Tax=Fusarium torulosum TaxID=33205 RepID=A0AAE8MCV6_9HYPO|nr:uncharacterized protein FTOL_08208 [Fusarium torulosum]
MRKKPAPKLAVKATREARRQHDQKVKERKLLESEQLVIDQANFKGSHSREAKFLQFQGKTTWREPDIIVLCDASSRAPWRDPGPYHLEMKPCRPLVETDNPDDPNRQRGQQQKPRGRKPKDASSTVPPTNDAPVDMTRVGFLIHKSISRDRWNVQWHGGVNQGMVATLHLMTAIGEVRIHSIYNPNQPGMTMNIPDMAEKTTASGRDIIMGDFNLHHPSWSGPLFRADKPTAQAALLAKKMLDAGMRLKTTPGTETFTAGEGKSATRSCIDLTFVSPSLNDSCQSCEVYKRNPWPNNDHRPIRTIFNIEPVRDTRLYYQFNETDGKHFNNVVASGLPPLDELKAHKLNETEAAELTQNICSSLKTAIDKTVPTKLACTPPISRPMDPKARDLVEGDGIASGQSETIPDKANCRTIRRREERAEKKTKANTNRDARHQVGLSTNGKWEAMKRGERRSQPRIAKDMPNLKGQDNKIYVKENEKHQVLFKALWGGTDKLQNMKTVPFPDLEPSRKEHAMKKSLEEKEVKQIINSLSRGKASGHDGIPNEALKLARDTLVPYLTILFRACLELGYYPDAFKSALTIIIPKPDKESYEEAKSWRPIALLSSIGKLLDKILTSRLKKVALDNLLIPENQYGLPGRSTTQGLNSLLNIVHRHWSRKKNRRLNRACQKVTMMGLDIAGAFDNVDRQKLLQTLADKGLPEWYLRIMQSFLSDRFITLRLPQSTSDPARINIGIPQGSPISSLLFLFFVAPLLEMLSKKRVSGVWFRAFAYVDDTYLVVASQSYEQNCKALKSLHDGIMEWSEKTGLTFSAKKYSIMHFNNPREKANDSRLLPDIEGVAGNLDCFKEGKVKVLGVVLDSKLTFEAHVDDIGKKFNKKLRHLRFATSRKLGLKTQQMRDIYTSGIRPIATYACDAWYLSSPTQKLSHSLKTQVNRLDSIQYRALKPVTAYFGKPSQEAIQKEFNIPNISIYLHQRALSARALSLGILQQHPYVPKVTVGGPLRQHNALASEKLDQEAQCLATRAAARLLAKKKGNQDKFLAAWSVRKKRKDAINAQASEEADERSAKIWDKYRRKRAIRRPSKHRPAILKEEWGPQSLEYYKDMSRAESTLLLELRTERIGLNGPLNEMKARRPFVSSVPEATSTASIAETATATASASTAMTATASTIETANGSTAKTATATACVTKSTVSSLSKDATTAASSDEIIPAECPCGHRKQTVYHMFFHCPDLHTARQQLVDRIGELNWNTLLTEHAKTATQWAMAHFPLAQYDYLREDSPFYNQNAGA